MINADSAQFSAQFFYTKEFCADFCNCKINFRQKQNFSVWSLSKTKLTGLCSLLNMFLYSLQSRDNKNPKHSEFLKIICFETSLPYRYLTYRPLFDAAWKALCIACISIAENSHIEHPCMGA